MNDGWEKRRARDPRKRDETNARRTVHIGRADNNNNRIRAAGDSGTRCGRVVATRFGESNMGLLRLRLWRRWLRRRLAIRQNASAGTGRRRRRRRAAVASESSREVSCSRDGDLRYACGLRLVPRLLSSGRAALYRAVARPVMRGENTCTIAAALSGPVERQ